MGISSTPMNCLLKRPIFCFILLVLMISLAFPVCAQGQSPTNPTPKPQRSSRLSGAQMDQQLNPPDLNAPGGLPSSRSRLKNRDDKKKTKPEETKESPPKSDNKKEPPKKEAGKKAEGEKTGEGAHVIQGGGGESGAGAVSPPPAAGGTPGATPAPPGKRAGAPGIIAPGAVPGSGAAAGGGTVSTLAGTAYAPIYEREVIYGDVPDEGEAISAEGPMACSEFLQIINMSTNWNILATEEAQAMQLQFWVVDKKPKEALEILKFHDIHYEWNPETMYLYVMTKNEWLKKQYGTTKSHEFAIKDADVSYIESIISGLLSEQGRMITDQRTSRIYVWDTQDNLDQMIKTVAQLDVPLEKEEFTIRYADLADIEAVLSSLMSPNGSVVSDPRTAHLFAWDSPSILAKMKEAVARLDVPVESRTIDILYVNAEDVVDTVEPLLSERGLIQIDPRYNTVVVTDLPNRVERISETIKTLDRQLETRTWVIKYADLDFIADQVESLIPDDMGEIITNEDVHQITIRGLPNRLDEIDKLIKTWDIKRRQVLIEAYIAEVDSDVERQFSINWSYFGTFGNVPIAIHSGEGMKDIATASGSGETMSVGQLPYKVPLYGALQLDSAGNIIRPILNNLNGKPMVDSFGGDPLAVTLSYLDKTNKATILSSPKVVVQDGEEATFENATRVPYISATSSNPYYGGSSYNRNTTSNTSYPNYNYYGYYGNSNHVEFIDVGTILSVLPRITEEDNVLLDISAEDSTYKDKDVKAYDQTSTVPEKTSRMAETQLRIHSGDTVVLGGLRRDRSDHSVTRTPLLADIPLLGNLFRNPSRTAKKNTLLIFIKTTIVDEYTNPEAETLAKIEDKITMDARKADKNLWDRLYNRVKSEIGVSIGESGYMHSGGKRITLDALRAKFLASSSKGKKVVIRHHPNAPETVITQVTEAAMEAGLKVDFDDSIPLVPSYGNEPPAPVKIAPAASLSEEPAEAPKEEAAPAPAETGPASSETAPAPADSEPQKEEAAK